MSAQRQLAVGAVMTALLIVPVPTGRAVAHAELVELEPAPGATLEEPPQSVVARFDEELDTEASTIELIDASGRVVARGAVDLDDLDHRTMTLAVPQELPDGVFDVRWQVVSVADHHQVVGEASFAVGEGASAPPDVSAVGDEPGGTTRAWLPWLATAVAAGTAVALTVHRSRPRRHRADTRSVNARSP